ncbi:hypothetical protein HYFRA_00002277 [Hymenoscyphus fraxineus]|uniref:Uncharacterized protein n=1 Tax=Hymenoscyphus fraxineus TaxID=746836 RepID=A0A9N9PUY3_9HELO|nr:hypothetical protein HYFRA_00002277 [Hymenoscyphus fraxineus]
MGSSSPIFEVIAHVSVRGFEGHAFTPRQLGRGSWEGISALRLHLGGKTFVPTHHDPIPSPQCSITSPCLPKIPKHSRRRCATLLRNAKRCFDQVTAHRSCD